MREGNLKKSLSFSHAKWKIQKKKFPFSHRGRKIEKNLFPFHAGCGIPHPFPSLRRHSVIYSFTFIIVRITITILIKNRFISQLTSIHFVKTCIISSHVEIRILIHKISLFEQNYLFELAKSNFSVYFYIVNISINVITIEMKTIN